LDGTLPLGGEKPVENGRFLSAKQIISAKTAGGKADIWRKWR
jgi:hypothetical protein